MKISTIYTCGQCAYQSSKWLGKCPQCEAWNSFAEEQIKKEPAGKNRIRSHARKTEEFTKISANLKTHLRQPVGIPELDRVLGGGIAPGTILLFTGEPGIGKSTLILQTADKLSGLGKKILYVSGEESEEQISMRGQRLALPLKNLKLLTETNLETILATTAEENPDLLIIDSIQVISSQNILGGAGSISQVRLCTEAIMEFAKPKRLPVILTGHVTKDGTLAGPRVLEHLVDAVFYLEGERFQDMRILRGVKNRFGGTNEIGVFEMNEKGLACVPDPSARFLKQRSLNIPGAALVSTVEGSRPFIVEAQTLVSQTRFGYPRRTASGFDLNRLNLLIAVIEKYLRINLGAYDVFVKTVGGFKLVEPCADLGVVMAVLSSFKNRALPEKAVYAGEVGLSGEIQKIPQFAKRKKEAEQMGFALIPNAEQSFFLTELTAKTF